MLRTTTNNRGNSSERAANMGGPQPAAPMRLLSSAANELKKTIFHMDLGDGHDIQVLFRCLQLTRSGGTHTVTAEQFTSHSLHLPHLPIPFMSSYELLQQSHHLQCCWGLAPCTETSPAHRLPSASHHWASTSALQKHTASSWFMSIITLLQNFSLQAMAWAFNTRWVCCVVWWVKYCMVTQTHWVIRSCITLSAGGLEETPYIRWKFYFIK